MTCVEFFLHIYFLLLICCCSISENDYCERETCNKIEVPHSFSEFDKNYAKYLKLVETAKHGFHPVTTSNCSCFFTALQKDLKPFKAGVTLDMIERVRLRGVTYVIYKQKLFRTSECSFPARCAGVEYFLKLLLPNLPDVEFVLNVRDWPQISKHFEPKGPVFSFSKTPEYLDIQYPAWSFWEGGPAIKSYPTGIGRWDLMRDTLIKEYEKWPWGSKINTGFFRGSRTSEERDAIVLLSRSNPDLVDAAFTKNQAWKSLTDTLNAEPAAEVPLEEHCRYKYLFNMRGVAASFRLKHLFLCGSLVIHFGDDWSEFFYDSLIPWIHYIPMPADASQQEISSLLKFLRDHDDIAREIAERGHRFIRDHLRMKEVKCYWRHLIRRYAKLLNYKVTVGPNLIEVN